MTLFFFCHFLGLLSVVVLSRVQLLETPWTVAPRLLCPWILQASTLEWVAMPSSRGSS